MIKKVAILANGGDVSGFNAVIRSIVKTAENNGVECYGFIDGYRGLLKNDYIKLSSADTASGILQKGGSIISSSTNLGLITSIGKKVALPKLLSFKYLIAFLAALSSFVIT